ncbi:unnamed protein product, partial [Meganyctiphanes norvegica]
MKTTEVKCAMNLGSAFRFKWMIQGRKRVADTGAESILAAKGIHVVDPEEVFTQAYVKHQVPEHLLKKSNSEEAHANVPKQKPCYIFHKRFSPIAGISQVQHITNSVVRNELPESILGVIKENSTEEDEYVKESIVHAHLLDSHQEKLPRIIDVVNRPGWSFPREYGIPLWRKNNSLTYQLQLILDKNNQQPTSRYFLENGKSQVSFNHFGEFCHMIHEAAFILVSTKCINPILSNDKINETKIEVIPDIYPLSPLINCHPQTKYELKESSSVPNSNLYPHTVHVHHNQPIVRMKDDEFYARSLIHSFSHAAAYAKSYSKQTDGILEKPVVLQCVHNIKEKYHFSVFQLNTLDLTSSIKNVFWTQPYLHLFNDCIFKGGMPKLEGYNPQVFKMLKAFHIQA